MNKIKLDLEALSVESFDVAPSDRGARGTVEAFERTRGQNAECASAVDACPSRLCDTVVNCETIECSVGCPTYDMCPSAYDACPTQRGCY